jgi:HSP20 family protein
MVMSAMVPFNRYGRTIDAPVNFYNMLDDFFNTDLPVRRTLAADTFKIDVLDDEDAYLVEAEVPGVAKEEVNIEFDNDRLTIAIEHSEEKDDTMPDKKYVHRERRVCSMSRSVYLRDVDSESITAKLNDGVLTVTVPKHVEQESSHKVTIE